MGRENEDDISSDRGAAAPGRASVVRRYDARNGRRVSLRRPAAALLANRRVEVHDLSETGFGIAHDFRLQKGQTCVLEFRWGTSLSITCTVIRCVADGMRFRSGLAIERAPREFRDRVAEALARKAMHEATLPSFFSSVRPPK